MNSAFLHMAENPYDEVSLTLNDKSSILKSVKNARLDLFCKKNKSLPPTQSTRYNFLKGCMHGELIIRVVYELT